jgi:hypothetical protein
MSWLPRRVSRAQPDAALNPKTGNSRLDAQIMALRHKELREVPFPTPISPALANNARSLMLEACDGREPKIPLDADDEWEREQFMNRYFQEDMLKGLPEIMAHKEVDEPGLRLKRLKVYAHALTLPPSASQHRELPHQDIN